MKHFPCEETKREKGLGRSKPGLTASSLLPQQDRSTVLMGNDFCTSFSRALEQYFLKTQAHPVPILVLTLTQ